MKRQGWMVMGLLLLTVTGFAQFRANTNNQRKSNSDQGLKNKFYFGGGGGFGAGTGYNYYSFFPMVGYRVTEPFSVGTGFTYQRYNYTYASPTTSLTQYGLTPFMRYNVRPLFFQTELDLIKAPNYNGVSQFQESGSQLFTRLLFGVGYSTSTGRRGALNALVMYDVLYRTPSVFQSPFVVRVFFTF